MAAKNVTDTTDATFETEVLGSDVPVLVDFWATWCGPCKAIAPHVESLANDTVGKLKVVKLDVQANMKTAQKFGVTNIPTLIVFKGGKPVNKQVGAVPSVAALRKLVDPHL